MKQTPHGTSSLHRLRVRIAFLEKNNEELRDCLREALAMLEIYYVPNASSTGEPLPNERDRSPTIWRIKGVLHHL